MNRAFNVFPACIFEVFAKYELPIIPPNSRPDFIKT